MSNTDFQQLRNSKTERKNLLKHTHVKEAVFEEETEDYRAECPLGNMRAEAERYGS